LLGSRKNHPLQPLTWVAVVAIGASFVATIYPSWSASGILPAEALRYE
jgi:lipoprotein-releasing system permease protein